jgi:rare lipoprotein A
MAASLGTAAAPGAAKRLRSTEAKKLTKPAVKRVSRPAAASRARVAARPMTGGGWRTARASWYGPGFYGNTMAGGGKLTPSSMVVAHRSLPFGTRLEVSYRGRSVTAVVRDRGPFIAGRTFDLGPGTAKALGFSGVGTIKYRVAKR